jgi:DNA-binding GntR family transcriptional regulator
MAPRRLVRQKTSTAVVDHILERLFNGEIKSGDRIDHDELELALGVSRLPIREAIVVLERDGIVSTRYHRGVFVEPFDGESILDDFEIMGLLSGLAVRRLAEKQDRETIAVLEALLEELRVTRPAERDQIFKLVSEIMTTEHRAGGSRRLRAQLRAHAGFLPQAFQYIDRSHAATVKAHERVLDAVVNGDGELAAERRLEDFRDAGRSVVRALARRGVIDRVSPGGQRSTEESI